MNYIDKSMDDGFVNYIQLLLCKAGFYWLSLLMHKYKTYLVLKDSMLQIMLQLGALLQYAHIIQGDLFTLSNDSMIHLFFLFVFKFNFFPLVFVSVQ